MVNGEKQGGTASFEAAFPAVGILEVYIYRDWENVVDTDHTGFQTMNRMDVQNNYIRGDRRVQPPRGPTRTLFSFLGLGWTMFAERVRMS